MANVVVVVLTSLYSYARNKNYVVPTVYWKASSVVITKMLIVLKAQQVKTCCNY